MPSPHPRPLTVQRGQFLFSMQRRGKEICGRMALTLLSVGAHPSSLGLPGEAFLKRVGKAAVNQKTRDNNELLLRLLLS